MGFRLLVWADALKHVPNNKRIITNVLMLFIMHPLLQWTHQWVVSFFYSFGFMLTRRPYVLGIFYGTIFTSLTRHAGLGVCSGVGGAGVVTVIQRFGSTLNLNMHLHILLAGGG